ncbi:RagB/SusD family nutrient uptake outer membrane protein [Hymenobacter edaphi]|uniref:RagB/SusD family nutrient uptake outer membrane protein n=1 Tax=Hymenobacter edaphi TaxID=2211146 RepID=A0A328BEB7_9BACT|nr:RagB/SusD family nutrient uptake outer membrane protein [Hymenobacter edaphi]RAK65297.1 hypothetical protein DLM85_17360 [Hymenobacter edaphi]
MHKHTFRRVASAAAFLLTLGFGTTSCDDVVEVDPRASLDLSTGLSTPSDVQAGLRGSYDAVQSVNYWGLRYMMFADLGADNARHTGTFPTFAQIANNLILPDNTELASIWNIIYSGINRCNYVIVEGRKITDPSFTTKGEVIAQARALRAFHYMNLLGYWGGTPEGYGYPGGLGVPLRMQPTADINSPAIQPLARSSEAVVVDSIKADLTYAISKLPNYSSAVGGGGSTNSRASIGKVAALALRMRLELRLRNYAEVINYANQIQATYGTTVPLEGIYANIFSNKFSTEAIWELPFDAVDANQIAFFWFPTANGGRNEVDPATTLAGAHETGDSRLPVNVASSPNPTGATRKFFRVTGDDNVLLIRTAEVLLSRAEAYARNGQLFEALTDLNRVRARAGLAARAGLTQAQLITAILSERRIELANEGHRWFDLRRTNTVQTVRTDVTQTYRNLWPIPQRERQTTQNLVEQNPNY